MKRRDLLVTGLMLGTSGAARAARAAELLGSAALVPHVIGVPVFCQRDPKWANELLGYSRTSTIGKYGCALTCCAMLLKYYQASTDPHELNQWLKANNGFSVDLIKWAVVPGRQAGVTYVGGYNWQNVRADLNVVNREVDAGYPVIVEVRLFGSTHYVLVIGRSGSTYTVADPYYGDIVALPNSRYGRGDAATQIYGAQLYHRQVASLPTVQLNAMSTGKWVSADTNLPGAQLIANRDIPQSWEEFGLKNLSRSTGVVLSGDNIQLQAHSDALWVSADYNIGNWVQASRQGPGTWETFRVFRADGGTQINSGDLVNFQAFDGHWVCADVAGDRGGRLIADRNGAGTWEGFRLYFK